MSHSYTPILVRLVIFWYTRAIEFSFKLMVFFFSMFGWCEPHFCTTFAIIYCVWWPSNIISCCCHTQTFFCRCHNIYFDSHNFILFSIFFFLKKKISIIYIYVFVLCMWLSVYILPDIEYKPHTNTLTLAQFHMLSIFLPIIPIYCMNYLLLNFSGR